MNVAFLLHHTLFFLQASQPLFHIAVNLGKRCFVTVVAGVITLCVVPRIELTKLNNYIIPFFLIWQRESYKKNIVFENREWHFYYFTLTIALSVFITICIFFDAYVHKTSNKNLPNISLNKKMHINVEQKSPVCLLSEVNREQHN